MIQNPQLAAYAAQLQAAGFTVHYNNVGATHSLAYLAYTRVVNGVTCGGFVARSNELGQSYWSHTMPIRPSRENGSSMFVETVPDTMFLTVADAEKVASPSNSNSVVGTQKNYVGPRWAHYLTPA